MHTHNNNITILATYITTNNNNNSQLPIHYICKPSSLSVFLRMYEAHDQFVKVLATHQTFVNAFIHQSFSPSNFCAIKDSRYSFIIGLILATGSVKNTYETELLISKE